MATYSIKEMSLLSGVKPHTIRIWEKRYTLFAPQRTSTNIRRYTDSDLKLLLNISLLLSMGYKISKIANLSEKELISIVTKGNQHIQPPPIPEILFNALISLNRDALTLKIDETIKSRGFEWTFENLIIPFMRRVGLLWQAGTITTVQEHFVTNIIREKLIALIHALPKPGKTKATVLFFLPEGEFHEIGLLYHYLIARQDGLNTIYLGQTVPLVDIVSVKPLINVDFIFTSITMPFKREAVKLFFDTLKKEFPKTTIMAIGFQVESNSAMIPKSVEIIKSAQQMRTLMLEKEKK
jgi:DNA-binding transcriptional MerR regulator